MGKRQGCWKVLSKQSIRGGGSHCSQTMACPNALSPQSLPTPLVQGSVISGCTWSCFGQQLPSWRSGRLTETHSCSHARLRWLLPWLSGSSLLHKEGWMRLKTLVNNVLDNQDLTKTITLMPELYVQVNKQTAKSTKFWKSCLRYTNIYYMNYPSL